MNERKRELIRRLHAAYAALASRSGTNCRRQRAIRRRIQGLTKQLRALNGDNV